MKRCRCGGFLIFCLFFLAGCGQAAAPASPQPAGLTFTDFLGRTVRVESLDRVVSLEGSFSEAWVLAGGRLTGTTSDAIEERHLDVGEGVTVVGSVKQPSVEAILALNPTLVILSDDIGSQMQAAEVLAGAGVPTAVFKVEFLQDYLDMMKTFTTLTGRDDLYQKNAVQVKKQADAVVRRVQGQPSVSVLFLRAFSTGAKAKGADHQTGAMLAELGAVNLADQYPSLLEEISLETVVKEDPDFIFVITMGSDSHKALDALKKGIQSSPAWAGLKAVRNGRYVVLPKELFHYKPNARWGESYAYLADILYPGTAAQP